MQHRDQETAGRQSSEVVEIGAAQDEDHVLDETLVSARDANPARDLEIPLDRDTHPGAVTLLDHHLGGAETSEMADE